MVAVGRQRDAVRPVGVGRQDADRVGALDREPGRPEPDELQLVHRLGGHPGVVVVRRRLLRARGAGREGERRPNHEAALHGTDGASSSRRGSSRTMKSPLLKSFT